MNFLENKNLFKKTGAEFFSWKYQVWKRSIPYKTTLWKANIKTNRTGSTKWTYHEERNFASNYFIFLKILFQFESLL